MEEKKQINKLSSWQRLGAILLDFVLIFFASLLIDRVAVNPIKNAVTNYNELNTSYNADVELYQKKQDEYGLYLYDASSSRYKNNEVSDENLEKFMNDADVIRIRNELGSIQDSLTVIRFSCIGIDAFIGSLLYLTFAYIIFGKGRSFGLVAFNGQLVDSNGNKPSLGKCILYGFLKWLFLFPLGVLSVLIIPITFLYQLFYHEQETYLDKKTGIYIVYKTRKEE